MGSDLARSIVDFAVLISRMSWLIHPEQVGNIADYSSTDLVVNIESEIQIVPCCESCFKCGVVASPSLRKCVVSRSSRPGVCLLTI